MNGLIAEHFQIGCQTTRTCKQCYKHEYQSPEMLTIIILPVLNGIHDLENSIARNMNDNVFIYCSVCGEDTEHIRSGKYLYVPETLALGFNRFKHKNGSGRKMHSKIHLPLEIKVMRDMLCHFTFRACALHHGQSIYNRHYTALLFYDGKVIEIDDHMVSDVTDTNWVFRSERTVYLAFYSKKDISNTYTQIDNSPKYCKDKKNKKRKDVKSENVSKGQDKSSAKPENIERFYDVTYKYKSICSRQSVGYDLLGSDFRTLVTR